MKADFYIIFICPTQIRSVTGKRQFKILWNSHLRQIGLCDLYIVQEDVIQIISAVGEGKEILFLITW